MDHKGIGGHANGPPTQLEKAHTPVAKEVRAGRFKGYPYNV